ncbi:hypothetical protein ACLB2K_055828 [Fragaria x ananassa]
MNVNKDKFYSGSPCHRRARLRPLKILLSWPIGLWCYNSFHPARDTRGTIPRGGVQFSRSLLRFLYLEGEPSLYRQGSCTVLTILLFLLDQISAWSQVAASNVVIQELFDSPKKITEHGVKITEPQEGVLTQASRALTIDPTIKGKRKLEVELSESDSDNDAGLRVQDVDAGLLAYVDGWDEEDEDDESGGDAKFTEDEDSEDDDYDPAKDDDDVAAYGVDDDFLFGWLTEVEVGEKNEEGGSSVVASQKTYTVEGPEVEDSEAMYGAKDSDKEVIGYELNSDDDGEGHQWPEFNPKTDMKNPRFCNGMLFASPRILRATVRERAIQKGWVPLWDMNDKRRLRAICQADNCNYELYASKMQHEDTFQIKRYQSKHSCVRVLENPTVRTPYLITRKRVPNHHQKTKNELRTKAQLRKAAAKDKRDEKRAAEKAAAMAAGKGLPTRSRPPKATTSTIRNASTNAQPSQASSRSSVRIRANANKGGK